MCIITFSVYIENSITNKRGNIVHSIRKISTHCAFHGKRNRIYLVLYQKRKMTYCAFHHRRKMYFEFHHKRKRTYCALHHKLKRRHCSFHHKWNWSFLPFHHKRKMNAKCFLYDNDDIASFLTHLFCFCFGSANTMGVEQYTVLLSQLYLLL